MAKMTTGIAICAFLMLGFTNSSAALYLDDYDQIEFNVSLSAPAFLMGAAETMVEWGKFAHRRVKSRLYPYQILTETLLMKDAPHLMMATALLMAGHDMTHPGQIRNTEEFMSSIDEQRTRQDEDFAIAMHRIEDMKRSPLFLEMYNAARRIDDWQTNVLLKSLIGEFMMIEIDHVPYLASMLMIKMIDEVSDFERS